MQIEVLPSVQFPHGIGLLLHSCRGLFKKAVG